MMFLLSVVGQVSDGVMLNGWDGSFRAEIGKEMEEARNAGKVRVQDMGLGNGNPGSGRISTSKKVTRRTFCSRRSWGCLYQYIDA